MSVVSSWARIYGLPDPMVAATEILKADAAIIRDAEARLRTAATVLRSAQVALFGARAILASGWSTPAGPDALATTAGCCRRLAQECRARETVAQVFAAAIEAARAETVTAIRAAESAAANDGLTGLAIAPEDALRVGRQRCALVISLHAATAAIANRLDRAAALATAGMDVDLRRLLPPGMTPPPRPAARQADQTHRAQAIRDLAHAGSRRAALAGQVLRTVQRIEADGFTAQLIDYSPDDPPRQGAVAIALGDVATADTVSVVVPGIGNSPASIEDTVDLAADLAWASESVGPRGSTSATVLWFGYDIPASWPADPPDALQPMALLAHALSDTAHAADATQAAAAGPQLGLFAHELRDMMSPAASLTLIGHSYGSVVVSQAARGLDRTAGVDDIVLLASPGTGPGVGSAGDYRAVGSEHVYTLGFPGDPVVQPITDALAYAASPLASLPRAVASGSAVGPFGVDPNGESFGGQRLGAASNVPISPGLGIGQHSLKNYLSGEALQAVAEVSTGQYASIDLKRTG